MTLTLIGTADQPEPAPRPAAVTMTVSTGSSAWGPNIIFNGDPRMVGPMAGQMSPPFVIQPPWDNAEEAARLAANMALPEHQWNAPDGVSCQDCPSGSYYRHDSVKHLYVIRELGYP